MERELEWWEIEEREIYRQIQEIQQHFQMAIKPYVDRLVTLQVFHPIRVTLTPDQLAAFQLARDGAPQTHPTAPKVLVDQSADTRKSAS